MRFHIGQGWCGQVERTRGLDFEFESLSSSPPLPTAEIRLAGPIAFLTGDEVSVLGDFPMPWDGNLAAEKAAAAADEWHPGTRSFRVVAGTPNSGQTRTQVFDVGSIGEVLGAILGPPNKPRSNNSILRLNIITHANPGLIGLRGKIDANKALVMELAADDDQGAPFAGGLDASVLTFLDANPAGRVLRDQLRAKFKDKAQILLFLCNGGLGKGVALAIDVSRCLNVRVLAYTDPIGYYVEFLPQNKLGT